MHRSRFIFAAAILIVSTALAADRTEITFSGERIFPESLSSTKDGTLYIGSLGQDSVYRAAPNSSKADTWIQPKSNGLHFVLGVLADEKRGTLWVCTSSSGGENGEPVVGETVAKAFDLKAGALKASYPFPGGGLCNDIAVAKDGVVYFSDTRKTRVLRLKKGATALDVWAEDAALLDSADGIALLADGAVYVNSVGKGFLVRIPVNPDGSAGKIVKLEASQELKNPDGMRTVGKNTMLLVEGAGRLDEVTINGDKAEIKTLKDGLDHPTAVTLSHGMAYVTEAKLNYLFDADMKGKDPGPFRVVGVPFKAGK